MSLRVRVWDVQHGSAAHIRTPNGRHVVIDCGRGDAGSPLYSLMRDIGSNRLDMAIITHPHVDHISDISNLSLLNPRVLLRPGHLTRKDILENHSAISAHAEGIIEKYLELDSRYRSPVDPGTDPTDPLVNGGAHIATFVPHTASTSNLNNHSVVTVIEYEGSKILIPGDNESPSWDELLDRPDFRAKIASVDVLVAAHHGRESGFHRDLFDHFNPLITIISDGRVTDTSATGRYSGATRGWMVHGRNGPDQERKCLTTRSDGTIDVEIGRSSNGKRFVSVTVG